MSFHALKTSGSSLKNIQWGLDTVSHNIANVNTNGFKKQIPTFSSVVNTYGGLGGDGLSGTQLAGTTTSFQQGALRQTGLFTDMAISGQGFFTLQTQTGELVYTRAGHFTTDANGDLVNPNGSFLMSVSGNRINFPSEAQQIEIGSTGEIHIQYQGEGAFQYYDQVQLATFVNPTGLNKIGNGDYIESINSGTPTFSRAGEGGTKTTATAIVSGAVETANTNLGEELTTLMSYQRSYQAVSRTTTTANDLLQTTINLAT